MRTPRSLLLLSVPLLAAPIGAQQRPDIPERARIRIEVQRVDSVGGTRKPLRGTGIVHRVGTDSISFRLDESRELWIAPWTRVHTLEVSEGMRRYTFGERAGAAAGITFLGAVMGYSSWHTCNEPEKEDTLSCIFFPRRLGTAVRGGTWLGLAIGLGVALTNSEWEQWRPVDRPSVASPFVELSARSGLMLGVSLRF